MKFLIVVDMQNDFISGALGSKLAEAIVPNVYGTSIKKAKQILTDAGFVVELRKLDPPQTKEEIKTMKTDVVMTQSIDAFTVITKKETKIILGYYDKIPELPPENENVPGDNVTDTPTSDNTNNQG